MDNFPFRVIDLTHTLHETIPAWDGSCGFEHHLQYDYDPAAAYQFRTYKIAMVEGIGTHIDAPAHCFPGGLTIDALPLESLIRPCVLLDISRSAHERYSLSPGDIADFEKESGPITPGTFMIVRTGWERLWHTPDKYHNNYLFPSISGDAAEFLLEKGIAGIGIDTLSPDRPEDGFPVHKVMLQAGKYIVENAANLLALPQRGSFIATLPLKTKNATEAPVRLVGLTT